MSARNSHKAKAAARERRDAQLRDIAERNAVDQLREHFADIGAGFVFVTGLIDTFAVVVGSET